MSQALTYCGVCGRRISCNITGTEKPCWSCGEIECPFLKAEPMSIKEVICEKCEKDDAEL
jgi:hypothetical protein